VRNEGSLDDESLIATSSSVPDELPLHPLVRGEQDALKDSTVDGRGFLSPLNPHATSHVKVTAAGLPRAIKFLSALLRALEQRGHEVRCSKELHPKLIALVNGEEIALRLVESVRLKPGTVRKTLVRRRSHPNFEYRTSTLTLYVQSVEFYSVSRKRADERHRQIEARLEEIVIEFARMAEAIKQAREERDRHHRELEKQRLLEEEARKQKKDYLQKGEVIKTAAQSLEMSHSIRRLIAHLESAGKTAELNLDLAARSKEMLEWCTKYADSLDPANQLAGLLAEFSKKPAWW